MSIEGKHYYRFEYLKSEQWQNVRIEALAREKGKCQICGDPSVSNDAHHVWYPESIWETTERHLVILCRCCHDFVHAMLPSCKTNDEEFGWDQWNKFKNALITWRTIKIRLFECRDGLPEEKFTRAAELRKAYEELKAKLALLESTANEPFIEKSTESQLADMLKTIKKWGIAFRDSEKQSKMSLDGSDYSI